MKKRSLLLLTAILAALLLSGCGLRTVNEMYRLPKRSEEYNHLQSAIDIAMVGLEYSAPLSGENQQSVQIADLNEDGVDEYLVFAKGSSEKPMQILIFAQDEKGRCQITEVIESNGSAFDQVEYVQIDDEPGLELVVSRRISDQLLRSVSVYTFDEGQARQLMIVSCFKFLACDLDENGRSELMVIHSGQTDMDNGVAALYSYQEGMIERSVEAELSKPVEHIKRIMAGKLYGGEQAIYVASAVDENAIITDVLALKDGRFSNISFSSESGTSVQTLRNYYVFADDVDDDGIMELPSLVTMQQLSNQRTERQYLIRWYALDIEGREVPKFYTFHNYVGGWYLRLSDQLANRVTVFQEGHIYTFYAWNEDFSEASAIFTVYALTGSDRENQAVDGQRFELYRSEGVIYAALLEPAAELYGITQKDLTNSFRIIHQDWKTGET